MIDIIIIIFALILVFGFICWIIDLFNCKPHSKLGQRILRLDEHNNPIEDKKK